MIGGLLLTATLAAGQPPVGAAPGQLPAVPSATVEAAAPADAVATAPAAEAEAPAGPSTALMKALEGTALGDFMADRRLTLSGFADFRYTATSADNLGRLPAGQGFNFNRDVPQYNWVTLDKAVDKEAGGPSFGYHIDLILYGSGYQYTLPRGLANYQLTDRDGRPNQYGYDPVQHYAEVYLPGLAQGTSVKVGRSFVRFGYESLNTTLNVLPTWSYAFTYNPFTQSGVFTDTKLSDSITVQNDFIVGNDNYFGDPTNRFYWWGSVAWAPEGGKTTAKVGALLGYGKYDAPEAFNNPQLVDFVLTHNFTDKLGYAFEFLYGWQNEVPDIGYADWYHFVNYLTYKWTDKLTGIGRVEFFDDVQGQRTGFAGLYSSFSTGVAWRPADWLMLRPELRYDLHESRRPFDGDNNFFGFTISGVVLW